ncbi:MULTISPECIES: diacylglycerol kinase family protein [unclassified Microcella]|uniref:diacylglycerol/lipid kinase family protein n=1 Tax=unclassified Microcella TaxID=2630066 RepID=UPI000B1B3A82|nr:MULTISPECIES: diacylglycerol kinase family protein [unclassified Microcella]
MRTLAVAINPTASFGRGREVGPLAVALLRERGHVVHELVASSLDALRADAVARLASAVDALVVVGGDGMVNLGVELTAGTGIPLGIIPSGTGNDMARGLGIALDDPEAAVIGMLAALDRGPRLIDAARIEFATTSTGSASARGGSRRFACVLSAGFDAIVNERANRMRRPRGRSRYTIALLVELARLRPIDYRLVVDGVELRERALLVSVGNNTSLGGGMTVTPAALLDDGLLDVMLVRPLSRLAFLRIFPRVFAGTHVTDPRVVTMRARRIRIEAEGIVAYADGERIAPLPIDVEVEPGALRVLA